MIWNLLRLEPKYLLPKKENEILREIHSDTNIIISKADKGGQIVVMDKHTYITGVSKLINEGPYCSIPKDPSTSDLMKVKSAIKSMVISGYVFTTNPQIPYHRLCSYCITININET